MCSCVHVCMYMYLHAYMYAYTCIHNSLFIIIMIYKKRDSHSFIPWISSSAQLKLHVPSHTRHMCVCVCVCVYTNLFTLDIVPPFPLIQLINQITLQVETLKVVHERMSQAIHTKPHQYLPEPLPADPSWIASQVHQTSLDTTPEHHVAATLYNIVNTPEVHNAVIYSTCIPQVLYHFQVHVQQNQTTKLDKAIIHITKVTKKNCNAKNPHIVNMHCVHVHSLHVQYATNHHFHPNQN